MIELTMERTKGLLAEAVAERGEDYVYTTPSGKTPDGEGGTNCFYVHYDKGGERLPEPVAGCIAGLVLHKAGLPLDTLSEHENSPVDIVLSHLTGAGEVGAESGVQRLLRDVQRRQDKGVAWGQAVALTLAEEPSEPADG